MRKDIEKVEEVKNYIQSEIDRLKTYRNYGISEVDFLTVNLIFKLEDILEKIRK